MPESRQHQQRSWTASGKSELSARIHLSLLHDCGHSTTNCLWLLPPCLPHDDGLHPHAMSHTRLSLKLFFVRYFVTAMRTLNGHGYLLSVKQEGSQGLVSSLKAVVPVTAAMHRPVWALLLTFGGIEDPNPECGLAHVNTLVADSGAGGVFRVTLPAAASRQSTRQTMSMLARDNRSPSQRISGRKEEAKQERD